MTMLHFDCNVTGRDFAVGDIHGCFSHLQRSLEAIGFDERVDRLFSVGDLVDRGPESEQVLEWLDRPWFFAIGGNHDFMAWRSALGTPYEWVDHRMCGGAWLDEVSGALRSQLGQRLHTLPLALEVQTSSGLVGLVHADCPFDDWQEMQKIDWAAVEPTSPLADCCLWSVERFSRQYSEPIRNVRAVAHGHRVVPYPKVLGNVHFIDTGGWSPGGYFSFLGLETLKPVFGPRATRPAGNRRNR